MLAKVVGYSYYLGQFDTNYIVFRNIEILKKLFLPNQKIYCEGK